MEKNVSSVAEQDKTAEVKKTPKLIELARPYKFDDKEYTEIDLSGLDDLTIKDAVLIRLKANSHCVVCHVNSFRLF